MSEYLWQSMASVAMWVFKLKPKDYMSEMKIIYDTIYGNLHWSNTRKLSKKTLNSTTDVYLIGEK